MELETAINRFLDTLDRAPRTITTYRYVLRRFVSIIGENAELNMESYSMFLASLKNKSPATQRIFTTAVLKLYAFCEAGNPFELKKATEHATRKPGKRIVNFNREAVEKVIAYCDSLSGDLEALRDRAFVLTLADTGLRISEACALKRSEIDWMEQRAIIIGKGDKQAVVRFSNRSIEALKAYLHARSGVEPNSRKPIGS